MKDSTIDITLLAKRWSAMQDARLNSWYPFRKNSVGNGFLHRRYRRIVKNKLNVYFKSNVCTAMKISNLWMTSALYMRFVSQRRFLHFFST